MKKFIANLLMLAVCLAMASASVSTAAEDTNKEKKKQDKQHQAAANKEEEPAIKLESVFVGDKEQPAISYFIPWQGIGAPDKLYWNVEEKHDNALDLVDREIMLRSMNIYEEMQLESGEK